MQPRGCNGRFRPPDRRNRMRPTTNRPVFFARGVRRWLGAAALAATLAAACTSSEPDPVESAQAAVTAAEQQVKDAQAALTSAETAFCDQARDYVLAIDRY